MKVCLTTKVSVTPYVHISITRGRGTGYSGTLEHIAILNMMLNKLHAELQKPCMHNNFYDNTMKFEELSLALPIGHQEC